MSLPLYPFDGDLCIGTVTEVGPAYPRGNLPQASLPEAQWHHGHRQGRGEVDDFVLIEISGAAIFGRIVNIRLAEKERLTVEPSLGDRKDSHPVGTIQLLSTLSLESGAVQGGIAHHPRLGSRIYAAHPRIVKWIAEASGKSPVADRMTSLNIASIAAADGTALNIAQLSNSWAVEGKRAQISTPKYKWEKVGDRPNHGPHLNVNEGPEALIRNGRIFVIYSASACWTDAYALGMLTAKQGSNLLDPKSWVKRPSPVFSGDAGAYSPGHNGFFQGADGKDWIVYHANSRPGQGCEDTRNPRAQPFRWKPDGTPDFGTPVSVDTVLPRP